MAVDIPDWTQGHILTPILLGTLQWGSLGGTITIPIPAGYADFWVTGGGLGFNGVQGSPSGVTILATSPGVFTLGDVPKSGANFDTGFTLSAGGGTGHSGRVQIYALPATALVYGDPDLPLPVRITQQGGVDQLVNLDQVGGVAVTLGQKAMAASVPVALASDQSALAVAQSGGPWSDNLTQVGGAALSLGQKTMAASLPVVVASDQSVLTVKGSPALQPTAIARFSAQVVSAGGTLTLVAAVANQKVYGFGYSIDSPTVSGTASEADLEDDSGAGGLAWDTSFGHTMQGDFGGAPISQAAGRGVRIRNQSGAAIIVRGFLAYSQF